MYCIFPVLKSLACGRQSQCLGWTYKLLGDQFLVIKPSPLSVGFPQRRPSNLINRPFLQYIKFLHCPKDPAVLETLRDSELLRHSVFTAPPIFTTL